MKKFKDGLIKMGFVILSIYAIYLFWSTDEDSIMNQRSAALTPFDYMGIIDAWNVIFGILFVGVLAGLFFLLNYLTDRVLKIISRRFHKLKFLADPKFDKYIQMPIALILMLVVFLVGSNIYVQLSGGGDRLSVSEITEPQPVVVFGTSKMLSSGKGVNRYWTQRIDAALELYRSGKVLYFVLTGDGLGKAHKPGTYNETRDMKADLMAGGVPESIIKIDSLGLRTVDSSLRLRGLLHTSNVIYVSQEFHTTRAIAQGKFYGIHARAYETEGSGTLSMWKKELLFSRPAAIVVDFMLANVQPVSGEVKYRESFEVKSNKHVAIIFGLVVIIIAAIIGTDRYLQAKPEKRKKIIISFSTVTLGSVVLVGVMVVQVYKTTDINNPFFSALAESIITITNPESKPDKLIEKERQIQAVIQDIEINNANFIAKIEKVSLPYRQEKVDSTGVEVPVVAKEEPRKIEFNTAVSETPVVSNNNATTSEPAANSQTTTAEKTAKQTADDFFNTAEGEDDDAEKPASKKEQVKKRETFSVKVNSAQTLEHNGLVRLKLNEEVTINGETFPKNYAFEGTVSLFSGRFIIVSDALGGGVRNFDGSREGNVIEARHEAKKGTVVLGDGELLTFRTD